MGASGKEADLEQSRPENNNSLLEEPNYEISFRIFSVTGDLTAKKCYRLKKLELKTRLAEIKAQYDCNEVQRRRIQLDAARLCFKQCSAIPEKAEKTVDRQDKKFTDDVSEIGGGFGQTMGRAFGGRRGALCGKECGKCLGMCIAKMSRMWTRDERIKELEEKEMAKLKEQLKNLHWNTKKSHKE